MYIEVFIKHNLEGAATIFNSIVDKAHEDEATRLGGKGDYHQVRSEGGEEVLREQPQKEKRGVHGHYTCTTLRRGRPD